MAEVSRFTIHVRLGSKVTTIWQLEFIKTLWTSVRDIVKIVHSMLNCQEHNFWGKFWLKNHIHQVCSVWMMMFWSNMLPKINRLSLCSLTECQKLKISNKNLFLGATKSLKIFNQCLIHLWYCFVLQLLDIVRLIRIFIWNYHCCLEKDYLIISMYSLLPLLLNSSDFAEK